MSGQSFFLKFALIIVLLSLLLTPAFAILQSGNIKIFAVTEDNRGMAADLYMYTVPGTGKAAFVVSNSLVGKDTQTTGNIAIQIAQKLTNSKITDKDVIFDIRANATEVDGPSAGAAMTILAYSMLSEKPLNKEVALTGTINSDGSIGMVGGVGAKSQAASGAGIKLFMIPSGEAITDIEIDGKTETVNLLEYGPQNLGIKVVEVSKIEQAIEYAYSDISAIKVDANVSTQNFVPKSIRYDSVLAPMVKISNNYISEAKAVISDAKTELETSDISDELRADLYQKHSATKRNVEMAQRFLDQNYLYSAANYAFNARVMAGTINEVAQNPSILSLDSTILDSKVSALKKRIDELKKKMDFVPVDEFEWIIGAQQRVAYADDAIKTIESVSIASVPTTEEESVDETELTQSILFSQVYSYVSAEAWVSVAEDFLKQAQSSKSKKVPIYTKDFSKIVSSKLDEIETLLNDSNVSEDTLAESERRFNSAKISYDNNFLFAALYDAYISEAFVVSEANRQFLDQNTLFGKVEKDIAVGTNSDSIWANMYFDHAKFYYENAVFNAKLGRTSDVVQSTQTSYDLIYLGNNLAQAKTIIEEYLAFNKMDDYDETEPVVNITYTKTDDPAQYMIVLLMILSILLVSLVLLLGLASKAKKNQFTYDARKSKVELVLKNLDKALLSKKISDAEYFFMKKKYEEELREKKAVKRKDPTLSIDDLKAKQRALERGLVDLKRHYKAGLIIPDDYEKNSLQVSEEIVEIKSEIRVAEAENRLKHRSSSPFAFLAKRLFGSDEDKIKGTEELAVEEKRAEVSERARRRRYLKRFAYKKEKN